MNTSSFQSGGDPEIRGSAHDGAALLCVYYLMTIPRIFSRSLLIVIALDEMHSSAVLSLLFFFIVKPQLELVRVWRETSRHRHRRHPSRRGLAQSELLLFYLGKPRTKGSRFALARLTVKYGYYITG